MLYEERLAELEKRAEWIEGLENTTKYDYTTQKEDSSEYFAVASKRLLVMFGSMTIVSLILIVVGIVLNDRWVTAIGTTAAFFFGFFMIAYFFLIKKSQKREHNVGEVKLAFNAYGVVLRDCTSLKSSVYAYQWNDFEQITEYKKSLVGIKDGLAFIFPKRIFSIEEYERFRNMSFAVASKKCFYKNFTPKNS